MFVSRSDQMEPKCSAEEGMDQLPQEPKTKQKQSKPPLKKWCSKMIRKRKVFKVLLNPLCFLWALDRERIQHPRRKLWLAETHGYLKYIHGDQALLCKNSQLDFSYFWTIFVNNKSKQHWEFLCAGTLGFLFLFLCFCDFFIFVFCYWCSFIS